jgi:hypothetical protein
MVRRFQLPIQPTMKNEKIPPSINEQIMYRDEMENEKEHLTNEGQ